MRARLGSMGRILLAPVLALSLAPLCALDTSPFDIADDSQLRAGLYDSWFKETPASVLAKKPFIAELPSGQRVQVKTEAGRNEFGIVLAREHNGSFPGWAQGSWVLTRDRKTGEALRIRIFMRSDPYTYIQFQAAPALPREKSLMDLVIYDANIVQSIDIPIPFDRLMNATLNDILSVVGERAPLKYFDPQPEDYRDVRALISRIRGQLGGLNFEDDGAIDENGNYVFIETLKRQGDKQGLNCSGFAKWVIDGILRPLTGARLAIAPLKQPFGERGSEFTDAYEATRDPFFGLDWIRNLASVAGTTFKSPFFGELSEFEVRKAPFASTIVRTGALVASRPYPGYLINAGFGFEGLQALLYTLAIDEPGYIYLGAVNAEMLPKPRMRQYFHIAVLIPYFDESDAFRIAVFESAAETNFTRFKNRYPNNYINLVRIPVEASFDP